MEGAHRGEEVGGVAAEFTPVLAPSTPPMRSRRAAPARMRQADCLF